MTDTSEIKINLSSDSWDNRFPGARVSINDQVIYEDLIKDSTEINWEGDVQESNTLTIEMYNKQPSDTVLNNDTIIKDVVLNIDNIEIRSTFVCSIKPSSPTGRAINAPASLSYDTNIGSP